MGEKEEPRFLFCFVFGEVVGCGYPRRCDFGVRRQLELLKEVLDGSRQRLGSGF